MNPIVKQNISGGYSLYSQNEELIAVFPAKQFQWISQFDKGLARVKTPQGLWGIIDSLGNEVLAPVYKEIWNFYGKGRNTTRIEAVDEYGNTRILDFNLSTHQLSEFIPRRVRREFNIDDDYGTRYGEFTGSYAQDVMGYSDDVINDAFEGDPDAYWNID